MIVLKIDLKHERSFEIDDDINMLSLFRIYSRWLQILGHIKTQNYTIDKKTNWQISYRVACVKNIGIVDMLKCLNGRGWVLMLGCSPFSSPPADS